MTEIIIDYDPEGATPDENYVDPGIESQGEAPVQVDPQSAPSSFAFLELDDTGVYVTGVGFSKHPPANSIPSPDQMDPFKFSRTYIVNDELVQRPEAPRPEVLAGGGYRVANCPIGTIVIINDLIGKEMMAQVVTSVEGENVDFALPDNGLYEIEVDAPFPHVDTKTNIEVE